MAPPGPSDARGRSGLLCRPTYAWKEQGSSEESPGCPATPSTHLPTQVGKATRFLSSPKPGFTQVASLHNCSPGSHRTAPTHLLPPAGTPRVCRGGAIPAGHPRPPPGQPGSPVGSLRPKEATGDTQGLSPFLPQTGNSGTREAWLTGRRLGAQEQVEAGSCCATPWQKDRPGHRGAAASAFEPGSHCEPLIHSCGPPSPEGGVRDPRPS